MSDDDPAHAGRRQRQGGWFDALRSPGSSTAPSERVQAGAVPPARQGEGAPPPERARPASRFRTDYDRGRDGGYASTYGNGYARAYGNGYADPYDSGYVNAVDRHTADRRIEVSVPAVRTVVLLVGTVVISVVLSVIATITLIAVMNAGVILPQYSRYNQPANGPTHVSHPTQVSQLGICVGKKGRVWTPRRLGSCSSHAKFVLIHPHTSHSPSPASHSPSPASHSPSPASSP